MRDALTDDVVERDEGPRLPHRLGHRDREQLRVREERTDQFVRQVRERLVMLSRHEQRVSGEQGTVVEEGDRALVLEDHVRRLVTGDDLTEAAIRVLSGHVRDTVRAAGEERNVEGIQDTSQDGHPWCRWRCCSWWSSGRSAPGPERRSRRASTSGKTTQAAIGDSFRAIQFTVKKGKVTITTEPSVARQSCISTPVFTQDGTAEQEARPGPHLHAHAHVPRQQDRQDPRQVRELGRDPGLRDLPLRLAGPLLRREEQGQLHREHRARQT